MRFEIEVVGGKAEVVDTTPELGRTLYLKQLYDDLEVPFIKRVRPWTNREAEILITELERKNDVRQDLEVEILELNEEIARIKGGRDHGN